MWWKMAMSAKVMPGNLDKPVAMRLVHSGNRSTEKFRSQIMAAHQEVKRTLWRWCKKGQIPFNRRKLILEKLISGELRRAQCLPDQFRHIEGIIRLPSILVASRTDWQLSCGEILYAFYHASGLHGLARRLARLMGKDA